MGTTTNYGLPYPELTDPPDGAGQIKALATAVDAELLRRVIGQHGRSFTSTAWPCPNGGWTNIAWENGGAAAFVTPVRGLYMLGGAISWANGGGTRNIRYLVDGLAMPATSGGYSLIPGTSSNNCAQLLPNSAVQLNAGQSILCQAYQNSGAALNMGAVNTYTSGWWIIWFPN